MSRKIFQILQILSFVMLLLLTAKTFWPKSEGWSGQNQRALAASLAAQGLDLQAARELQRYVENYDVPSQERPGIYVTIGNIYYGKLDFGNALAYYGRAEALDSRFAGDQNVPRRVVDSLTKLGRLEEAASARKKYTALDPSLKNPDPKKEAKIASQETSSTNSQPASTGSNEEKK